MIASHNSHCGYRLSCIPDRQEDLYPETFQSAFCRSGPEKEDDIWTI